MLVRASLMACGALLFSCSPSMPNDAGIDGSRDGGDGSTCPIFGHDESQGVELQIGSGTDGTLDNFRVLNPGDTVYVTPGPQGLQHVLVAFRGRGFDPLNPLVEARIVRQTDCAVVGTVRFRLPFSHDASDSTLLTLPTVRVVLPDNSSPPEYCSILGQNITLVVDFDDLSGHTAHRELVLYVGGIDPATRPDLRQAWLDNCSRDGGVTDADE